MLKKGVLNKEAHLKGFYDIFEEKKTFLFIFGYEIATFRF